MRKPPPKWRGKAKNHIKHLLFDNRDLLRMFETAYGMRLDWDKMLNTSEVLAYIAGKDGVRN